MYVRERKDFWKLLPPDNNNKHSSNISIALTQPRDFSDCRVQLDR